MDKLWLLILSFVSTVSSLECPILTCDQGNLGNNFCNPECNNILCNFDSIVEMEGISNLEKFTESSCIFDCISTGCTLELLDNDLCDPECNNKYCAFDLGFCGVCAENCWLEEILDKKCNENSPCNTENCGYDNYECKYCAPGCGLSDLMKEVCENNACRYGQCIYIYDNPCNDNCAPGCLDEYLGNGICNQDCNSKSCNYDNGDCLCAPNCNFDEMQTDCKGISDPCNNYKCRFKAYKCGLCGVECTDDMIYNNICNTECYNSFCILDVLDCECTHSCSMYRENNDFIVTTYYKEVKACYSPECWFNIKNNKENFTKRYKILSTLMYSRFDYFDLNSLPSGCSVEKLMKYDSLDEPKCDISSPCYSDKALWCLGRSNNQIKNCLRATKEKCVVCDGVMLGSICENGLSDCPTDYELISNLTQLFNENSTNLKWCVMTKIGMFEHIPKISYVNSSEPPESTGDGTELRPYLSLFFAFTKVYKDYTKIILSTGKHIFKLDTSVKLLDRNSQDSPLELTRKLKLIIIEGADPESPAVVYWTTILSGHFLRIVWTGDKIVIKNIIFDGRRILSEDCTLTKEYCFYCPFFYHTPSIINSSLQYANDKFEYLSFPSQGFPLLQSRKCLTYNEITLFTFNQPAYLQNVTFKLFTNQNKVLIKSMSSLSLENVTFERIQTSSKGSILEISCEGYCNDYVFTFLKGSVRDSNLGYNIKDFTETGGFLKVNHLRSVEIQDVEFSFNLFYSRKNSAASSYLFNFISVFDTIQINRCKFSNIYAKSFMIFDMTKVNYEEFTANLTQRSEVINNLHIQLNNSIFENIFTTDHLISHLTEKFTQNLIFENLTFSSVFCADSSVINIDFSGVLSNLNSKVGEFNLDFQIVFLKQKKIFLNNLKFFDVASGDFLIKIHQHANVFLNHVVVKGLHDGSKSDVFEIIQSFYKNNKYLELMPRSDLIGNLNCSGSIKTTNCKNVTFYNVSLEDCHCGVNQASSGLVFENIENSLNLTFSKFFNVSSDGDKGTIFVFQNLEAKIFIRGIQAEMIFNSFGTIIEFINCRDVVIDSFRSRNLVVNSSSPIKVMNPKKFEMTEIDSSFIHNLNSDCGFIIFSLSIKEISTIRLARGTFENIWVYGTAGIFMFDSVIVAKSHNIYIEDFTFSNISAQKGTFLYIWEKVSINDSLISNIFGYKNSESGSMIYDAHLDGILSLQNLEFFNNSRILTQAIRAQYQGKGKKLEVKNLRVRDCKEGDNVIEIIGKSIDLTQVIFENIEITSIAQDLDENYSEALSLASVSAIFNGIEVKNMKSLADISNAGLVIYNGTLHEISMNMINSQKMGYFQCYNCRIFNNTGILFLISGESFLVLENSQIFENRYKGIKTSLFQIDSYGKQENSIRRTTIKDNYSQSSKLIELYNTNFHVFSCEFSNNTSEMPAASVLTGYSSFLNISNSTFQNYVQPTSDAFISLALSSSLIVSNSSFMRGASIMSGGAITIDNCLFANISGSLFKNNTSLNRGGAIYSKFTRVYILSSVFEGNRAKEGSDLYLSDHSYFLRKTSFMYTQALGQDEQFSIIASGSYFELSSVIFANFSFPLSGLKISETKEILISSSFFFGIHGLNFGAVFCEGGVSKGTLTISNSTFQNNNSSQSGGGLSVKDMTVSIIDSFFISNNAGSAGGGLYMQSPNCETCEFSINGESKLMENTALMSGGGVMWLDFKPKVEESVSFANNSALYGCDYATRPARIGLTVFGYSNLNTSQRGLTISAAPGQLFTDSLILNIYDSYGQIVSSDSSSVIVLKPSSQVLISGQSSFVAQSGSFKITGFTLRAEPGSIGHLSATINSVSSAKVRNDKTEYQNTLTIQVLFRDCEPGESIDLDTCTVCPLNKFLIVPEKTCKPCPEGGICPGGSRIWVKPGYFRTTNESEVIYKCQIREVCLGNKTGYSSECLEGYTGINCYACADRYTKGSNGRCSKCPDKQLNYFISALLVMSFLAICMILVITTIKSAFTVKSKYSIYMKIFTNYLQLIYLTTEFDLSWPSYLQSFFEAQRSMATVSDVFFSLDCFSELKTVDDYEKVYYVKLVLYSLLPVIILIGSAVVWWMICSTKEDYLQMKRELPLTIIVIFFLVHPGLVKFIYSSFSCRYLDKLGSFLTQNPQVRCWTKTHQKYSLYVSLPSILLWSLATPSLILILMIKQRKNLYKDYNRIIYGFICNGYKSSVFYWEFIILYRKLVLICLLVFTSQVSVQFQALSVELLLIAAFFLQFKIKPYNSNELNSMELESLVAANLTIYSGQFYLLEGTGDVAGLLLFFVIVSGNCFFIVKWAFWMARAVSFYLGKHFKQLQHFLKQGDAFAEDFNIEKIYRKGSYFDKIACVKSCTFMEVHEEDSKVLSVESLNQLYESALQNDIEIAKDHLLDSRNSDHYKEKISNIS